MTLRVLVTAVGVALGVFYPFISVILAEFGFSPGEIGVVFSLGAIGFTVAVPAWGHLADVKLGRPRTLQVCAVGAAAAVLGLLVPAAPLVIVALMLLFWIFECAFQPLADALTVNAVGDHDYARTRLFGSLGFALGAILSGFLYDRTGYWPSFVLFALAAAAIVVSAAFLPDVERADLVEIRRRTEPGLGEAAGDAAAARTEPLAVTGAAATSAPAASRRSWHVGLGSVGVAFRVAPRLGAVLLASVLLHVGILSGFTFLPLHLEALGGSPSDVALSFGLSALAEIPGMLVMGLFVRRLGLRGVFGLAALIYAACMASWMVIDVPLAIVATRAITGLAFAGIVVSVVLTIAAILSRDLQATGQALFQTSAFGIASIIANVIGGQLYETFGPATVFGLGAVLAVAAAGIGWFVFPRSRS